jgi:hypothetical protein
MKQLPFKREFLQVSHNRGKKGLIIESLTALGH